MDQVSRHAVTPNGPAPLWQLAADLRDGRVSAAALTELCLTRIADPAGQGAATFVRTYAEEARATAQDIDARRRAGESLPPFAGIPVSVKDLFDVAGDVTRAGSRVLDDAPPATVDSAAVARLRAAGFIVIGRTNMTEFAYSGLGLNPHYGTPRNPYQRERGRIPGGSSSGAAISVTDGMAFCGLGSDTGGSCRIPAAMTGLVGWKPTARRIPLDGVLPLSSSLDSVGCMAASVTECRIVDAILAGEAVTPEGSSASPGRLRLAVPRTLALDNMDAEVARSFERALSRLSSAGFSITHVPLAELADIPAINAKGGFTAAESYAWHRTLLEQRGDLYDPRVSIRILRGREQSAADYLGLRQARTALIERVCRRLDDIDALVMPTVPVAAPLLSELEHDDDYARLNLLALRNPTFANMLDGCSISLPMHHPDEPPAGLMLIARGGEDTALFAIAGAVEQALVFQ
ncbi:MAG: amidase [Pseudorhodoplanes sp.]|uniref:amidase n=1 Tax=Pseudorhodoplanes sp. TaxID=1934341 RepID=UPI003D0C7768